VTAVLPVLAAAIVLAAASNVMLRVGMRRLGDGGSGSRRGSGSGPSPQGFGRIARGFIPGHGAGIGRGSGIGSTLVHALRSGPVWAGSLGYVAAMGCWLVVLGRAEIGLVYPVFTGSVTFVVMLASTLLLGERLERRRVIGAVLMVAGILVASWE